MCQKYFFSCLIKKKVNIFHHSQPSHAEGPSPALGTAATVTVTWCVGGWYKVRSVTIN